MIDSVLKAHEAEDVAEYHASVRGRGCHSKGLFVDAWLIIR